jgi:hypothetical protein
MEEGHQFFLVHVCEGVILGGPFAIFGAAGKESFLARVGR